MYQKSFQNGFFRKNNLESPFFGKIFSKNIFSKNIFLKWIKKRFKFDLLFKIRIKSTKNKKN